MSVARLVRLWLLCGLCACNATHTDEEDWAAAEHFEIGLSTTHCFGSCPVYEMSVDERGRLHFYGRAFVEMPGSYDTELPVADVKRLYADMLNAGFVRMQDSYVSEEDGCVLATDAPTLRFSLRSDQRQKLVTYYQGCVNDDYAAVFERLRGLEEQIESTVIERFLGSRPLDYCRGRSISWLRGGSYVLKDGAADVGLLRVDERPTRVSWTAHGCDGSELSRGDVVSMMCEQILSPPEDVTLLWPGISHRQSAVRIGDETETGAITLHAIELEAQHKQFARAGTACAK